MDPDQTTAATATPDAIDVAAMRTIYREIDI
jgi:hypothetical protein